MSRTALLLLATLLAVPSVFAAEHVTFEQLKGILTSSANSKDDKVAAHLYGLVLTERLSVKDLAVLDSQLPGPKSRQALAALADEAEFLDLPSAEILNQPAPSVDLQRATIGKSITFAEAMMQRLPNFFARRDTTQFEDSPPTLQSTGDSQSGNLSAYQPLHPFGQSTETVLYRKGKEFAQNKTGQQGGSNPVTSGMITYGEFGPILSVLYGDLPKGNLRWSYWEQSKVGREAVFRFDVHKADSHYLVRFCCISGKVFQAFPAYHGEITIDPKDGTILRVTLIADMAQNDPIRKSELLVEYGPVELGGKKYFCPLRSISVARAPMQEVQQVDAAVLNNGVTFDHIRGEVTNAPLQTMLNETTFDNYHLFRADVQILTDDDSKGGSTPNAPTNDSHIPR